MSRIFINYRRQDSEGYAGRLYDHLSRHFAAQDIFMDVTSIAPGVDFVQALDEAVAGCDVFLALIGPGWLSATDETGQRRLDQWNDYVRLEIASALRQAKYVIPVLVGQARMPAPDALPEDIAPLARRNAFELGRQFAADVEQLVGVVRGVVPAGARGKAAPDSAEHARKAAALKALRDELVGATGSPLYHFRNENRFFPVVGDGNPDASLLFIGEAPGKFEAAEGRPFVGPSGEVLDEMLRGIGLRREDVFVTNLLLDHPGKRDPLPEEIAFYAPFVDRVIDIIRPAVIVPLGRFAMQHLLGKLDLPEKRGKISQLHGKLIKTRLGYGEIHVVPMYHPAVVLYSASQKDILRKDFERLKLFI